VAGDGVRESAAGVNAHRRRYLITGTGGRVGRAIWIRLARRGDRPQGLDRSPGSAVQWVADLGDETVLRRALDGVDALVHTAALHAPHVGHVSDSEFQRINVDATRRLLDLATAAGVSRIVFTSTTALYGDAVDAPDRAAWVDEALEPQPRTVYHRTKLAAEALLHEAAGQGGPSLRILRMSRCFPEPANAMAVLRLHRGIDARDVADAHARAVDHAGAPSETFVISGATPFRQADAERLKRDAPALIAERCPALVEAFVARKWPIPQSIDRVYCAEAAIARLGWSPRFGFDEVLRQYDEESGEVLPPEAAYAVDGALNE
jgi:nucleoside-diphosphate-sugar epimerase